MSLSPAFEFRDLKPGTGSFLQDVVTGLSAARKTIPPKYFYDERGSQLFEAICELPEYYPTRTELAMLEAVAPEIASRAGAGSAIVEYGSGSGRKTRLLIRALQPRTYVAVDIAGEQLRSAVGALAGEFPVVGMIAICADYTQPLPLHDLEMSDVRRRIVYFPGSTIGNFDPPEALAFLRNAREVAGRGGAMLVGVDMKKNPSVLHAAYNDAQGVTAAFNLNVLTRINRELGGDFALASFEHNAHYDETAGRIEMHLVSRTSQRVHIDGNEFQLRAGETIHTESSYKYTVEEFQALAAHAGFFPEHCWVDPQRLFSIHYLTVPA
jgi:dimethylhistidine N-methyltransferase